MSNETKTNYTDNMSKPLFTGNVFRDTSVSESEKAAEASKAIFEYAKKKLHTGKGETGKDE